MLFSNQKRALSTVREMNRPRAIVALLCLPLFLNSSPSHADVRGPSLLPNQLIAAGDNHTCAINTSGQVFCWGASWGGRLGVGESGNQSVPQRVTLPSSAKSIGTGPGHSCAIVISGLVYCWGENGSGEVAPTSYVDQIPAPVQVPGLSTFGKSVAIALTRDSTCSLMATGSVVCWGDITGNGLLGGGPYSRQMQILFNHTSHESVRQIASGQFHTCVLTNLSKVFCWGANNMGQLGTGDRISHDAPTLVSNTLSNILVIGAGGFHSCLSSASGKVQCWGNTMGDGEWQIGDGFTPTQMPGLKSGTQFTQIAVGYGHTCILTASGDAQCWGYGGAGQLGSGRNARSATPVKVFMDSTAVKLSSVSAGGFHTCGLLSSGVFRCWGDNEFGQLGTGSFDSANVPQQVLTVKRILPPGSPGLRSISSGVNSVTIQVLVPKVNGGSRILGYQYSIDTGKTWSALGVLSAKNQAVVKGLKRHARFKLMVRAFNTVGKGAASQAIWVATK